MPVTPLRPSDPAQVGPHRLLARLGQGGMGTVYLGISPDDRAVAVKVLRDGLVDPDARRRFRHELAALRRVRGPHLVEVLDADVDADTPYLVTRFVPGTRLDDLVAANGPLDDEHLHRVARGLADALATLHAAGVVHRDLTPGNVLVLDGQPHVIDLGLATAADVTALTRSGLVVGTPGYLAPEQVVGGAVGPEVDVHAWGATVALAGTGRPPYGTGRPEAVLYRIVHGRPDLGGLPEPFAALVASAMHPDPARRPQAQALLAVLGGTTDVEPVTVHLPSGVDATTLLRISALDGAALGEAPTRELAAASSGPRPTVPFPAAAPPGEGGWSPEQVPSWLSQPTPSEQVRHDRQDDRSVVRWDDDGPLDDPDRQAPEPAGDDPVAPPAPRREPVRDLQVLVTGAAALAVVAAATLLAPVVGAVVALAGLVLLRAAGRGTERLRTRQERRGGRRRDPVVAALVSPWHLLVAAVDTALSLPLLALGAAVPATAVWLASPTVSGHEPAELTAATAVVAALVTGLSRKVHAPSRRTLRSALLAATPAAASAVAVLVGLAAAAALLLATAEGAAAIWWPLR